MNDDDLKEVWREKVLPALSHDDRKLLQDVLLSSGLIAERMAKSEYHEGDLEILKANHKTFKELASKIKIRIGD
jgi:hypothetical protein